MKTTITIDHADEEARDKCIIDMAAQVVEGHLKDKHWGIGWKYEVHSEPARAPYAGPPPAGKS